MIHRGDIRWFRFEAPDKRRPVLVLGREDALSSLSQIPVIPLSRQTRSFSWEVIRFAAITLLSVLWSSSAVRAQCPAFTLEQKFNDSAAVFVGRVVGMKTLREPNKSVIAFVVDDLWKEPVEKKQTIIYSTAAGKRASIITCGRITPTFTKDDLVDRVVTCLDLRFELNAKFVVFADQDAISMCAPTARVDHAVRTLRWLADKPHTTATKSK